MLWLVSLIIGRIDVRTLYHKFICSFIEKNIPKLKYQLYKLGNVYLCTASDIDDEADGLFNKRLTCGSSSVPHLAKIKAISEYVERDAWRKSLETSTTGFAAYPFIYARKKAFLRAREHAYYEMIERYVWPTWSRNNKVSYSLSYFPLGSNEILYNEIQKKIRFQKYFRIMPKIDNCNVKVIILYAITEWGLACAGCARRNEIEAEQHALKELMIHAAGIYRYHTLKPKLVSNYDNRVVWIMNQEKLLTDRLKVNGNETINTPTPIFKNIDTNYSKCFVVQRCNFNGYTNEFISEKADELYV